MGRRKKKVLLLNEEKRSDDNNNILLEEKRPDTPRPPLATVPSAAPAPATPPNYSEACLATAAITTTTPPSTPPPDYSSIEVVNLQPEETKTIPEPSTTPASAKTQCSQRFGFAVIFTLFINGGAGYLLYLTAQHLMAAKTLKEETKHLLLSPIKNTAQSCYAFTDFFAKPSNLMTTSFADSVYNNITNISYSATAAQCLDLLSGYQTKSIDGWQMLTPTLAVTLLVIAGVVGSYYLHNADKTAVEEKKTSAALGLQPGN